MNKEIIIALCDHIQKNVPEIKWIDFDHGQLNTADERPPVDWPCCLIDISYPTCRDLALEENTQLVTANITLKIAFLPAGETHNRTPAKVRDFALKSFDIIEKLHNALQGELLEGMVSAISRSRASKQVKNNKVVVFNLTYTTTFQEYIENN